MNISEMLEFIDEVVEDKTGKPLTALQLVVLEGTLKSQKYSEIGVQNGFTEGHVRDVGYELLQLLSKIFDKRLHKRNLKRFLEKQKNINQSVFNFKKSKINYSYYCNYKDHPRYNKISESTEAVTQEYQLAKYQVQIETAKKLKNKGLTEAEIAEILEINREDLKNIF